MSLGLASGLFAARKPDKVEDEELRALIAGEQPDEPSPEQSPEQVSDLALEQESEAIAEASKADVVDEDDFDDNSTEGFSDIVDGWTAIEEGDLTTPESKTDEVATDSSTGENVEEGLTAEVAEENETLATEDDELLSALEGNETEDEGQLELRHRFEPRRKQKLLRFSQMVTDSHRLKSLRRETKLILLMRMTPL